MERPRPRRRRPRSDGTATRSHILEVAGRLLAERGLAATTSRDICHAAGTNLAAINYHFSGRAGLYDAVLAAAHAQLVSLDDLEAIRRSGASPRHQLRQLIGLLVGHLTGADPPWGLQLLLRELTSPSAQLPVLLRRAVLPKVRLMLGMLGELLGVPEDHPAAQQALAFAILPCVMMNIVPRTLLRRALPALVGAPEQLADALTRYALAGMRTLRSR